MKTALRVLGVVLVLLGLVITLEIIASESGEVVVVTTRDGDTTATTRLWVVDHDGSAWLRSGSPQSGWYQRMQAEPRVQVERQGVTSGALVVAVPAEQATINRLMRDKYGWADQYISMLFGREDAVPLRLDPAP